MICRIFFVPSLCLSLLLSTSLAAAHFGNHARYHKERKAPTPRDVLDHALEGSIIEETVGSSVSGSGYGMGAGVGTVGTGTGTGTGYSTQTSNNTFYTDWKTKGIPAATPGAGINTAAYPTIPHGVPIATTVPVYQICNEDGNGCTTAFVTRTRTICSTVLTGFFTRATISDCAQNVTFSTRYGYSAITSRIIPEKRWLRGLLGRAEPTTTTVIQGIVSYYVAPWQSIAANTPTGITVIVCSVIDGNEDCLPVSEVWIVHTEYVPVYFTSTITVSRYLPSPTILLLGESQSLKLPVGYVSLVTTIIKSSMIASETTSASRYIMASPNPLLDPPSGPSSFPSPIPPPIQSINPSPRPCPSPSASPSVHTDSGVELNDQVSEQRTRAPSLTTLRTIRTTSTITRIKTVPAASTFIKTITTSGSRVPADTTSPESTALRDQQPGSGKPEDIISSEPHATFTLATTAGPPVGSSSEHARSTTTITVDFTITRTVIRARTTISTVST